MTWTKGLTGICLVTALAFVVNNLVAKVYGLEITWAVNWVQHNPGSILVVPIVIVLCVVAAVISM